MKRALDTVAGLDQTWDTRKVALLVNGFHISGENLHVDKTAYELRSAAYDGGDVELIIDPAQLDKSIRVIRDDEVRAAMLLRTHLGIDEYELELVLRSSRKGHHLLTRGIELVRRVESTNAAIRKRDMDIWCYRCMKAKVREAGDECGECRKPLPGRPGGTGIPVEEWTLERLVDTQEDADDFIPGKTRYKDLVEPWGDPERAHDDKEWTRNHGMGSGRKRRNMRPSS